MADPRYASDAILAAPGWMAPQRIYGKQDQGMGSGHHRRCP